MCKKSKIEQKLREILKPMQSDLVGYRLISGQISGL